MIGAFQRRQLFVHPIQYWFVVTTLIYFSCLLIVLYVVVFLPMVQRLSDPSVTREKHVHIATQFLDLNARIWPWLIITFLVLLLHSLYFMHRIAGPLYRFTALFRMIGTGQLYQRARLRKHDYLHREAQAVNSMLDNLEQKIQTMNLPSAYVTQAYEIVALQAQELGPTKIEPALRTLEEEIQRLRTCLAEFELCSKPLPDQACVEFPGSSGMDSTTAMKAA